MSARPEETVRELSRRFLAGDREGAAALLHPDLRIEQPPSLPHGGVHRGHAGMAAMGTAFAEHWDRTIGAPRLTPDAGTDAGTGTGTGTGTVVQLTTQTWTAKATGRSATVDVVELLTVTAGLITGIRVFPQDTATLLATLEG